MKAAQKKRRAEVDELFRQRGTIGPPDAFHKAWLYARELDKIADEMEGDKELAKKLFGIAVRTAASRIYKELHALPATALKKKGE